MNIAVRILNRCAATLLACLLIVSCGGGLTVGTGGGIGGTGATAVSVGPITQFGSIFVNGVEYDLKSASIVVNGLPATGSAGEDGNQIALNNLAVGQVVKVQGTINADGATGAATQVSFSSDVTGPIDSVTQIDAATKQIVVLGQTVIVDNTTQFKNIDLNGLTAGIVVEVSGLVNSNGTLHATYMEKTADFYIPGNPIEVKGTIQNLDNPLGTFTLNNQTVDYTNASLKGITSLQNGQFVEVTGVGFTAANALQATSIQLESEGLGTTEAQRAEVEGFVTAVPATGSFIISKQTVQTTASTVYRGGLAADIAVGVKLEVEGTLQSGILTATQITFKDDVVLQGNVLGVDTGTNSLTLAGVSTVTVGVNSLTRLEGINSLADLTPGTGVKVRGRVDGGGTTVIATELDQESSSSEVTLQGPVVGISNPIVNILGIDVDTSTLNIGSQFFSSVKVGSIVKASGSLNGATVTWQEVEFED